MRDLLLKILIGIISIFLAVKFIPGVSLKILSDQTKFLGITIKEKWQLSILIGISLGFINFFFKPILKFITFPLRFLTLNFFSFLINLGLVELVDVLFSDLEIVGFLPLFLTTLIIWGLGFILGFLEEK
ncbi:hypothetical protein AMJ49_02375 [Parcubacteria bacterium DG_74_2]|nr:MAG: hypothetical protein AMJ49_02375 [Parcubacteria bacterium DG_74_2]